jgi:monothiol glutaredoxin
MTGPESKENKERENDRMSNPKILVYLKPSCGWSGGVRAVLDKHRLSYEVIDVLKDSKAYAEMVAKTGQSMAPCVEIDGHMLADVGGEEVEGYLLRSGLVKGKKEVLR